MTRHRRLVVLRGPREQTRAEAEALLGPLTGDRVLWVTDAAEDTRFARVRGRRTAGLLGQAFDAVALDFHDGPDADLLGRCHGFVRGGGALVLRMAPRGAEPPGREARLVVFPYGPEDVGRRFAGRFDRVLSRWAEAPPYAPCRPASTEVAGTSDQAAAVSALARVFRGADPALVALLADRGRGKSAALGLALAEAMRSGPLRVAVTAGDPRSAAEVFRFAPDAAVFVPPGELCEAGTLWDVIVVDEAAQLPVPVLRALALANPVARIAFASTCRGYEGTGRGFVLRFLAWAREQPRPLVELGLEEPIRWNAGDPLEAFTFEALVLGAEPAAAAGAPTPIPEGGPLPAGIEHRCFDRAALAKDEPLLRDLFGLLVHAHYRTTPSDLHLALDAPNLALHALLFRGRVVAASLVAREGGLPAGRCAELARGRGRIRGHALADTLITHAGHPEAGELTMVRSVRIAVHPELRRHGLASALVAAIHEAYAPDLFGTLFGATPELLRFRRAVGYELVRVGVSSGSRTGEPAAVMLHPVSAHARELLAELRRELALVLPEQLRLMTAGRELIVAPPMEAVMRQGLPEAPPEAGAAERLEAIARYCASPQPVEAAAWALVPWLRANDAELARLDPRSRALIRSRVIEGRSWQVAAREAGFPTPAAAMRAMRPAIRKLLGARIDGTSP